MKMSVCQAFFIRVMAGWCFRLQTRGLFSAAHLTVRDPNVSFLKQADSVTVVLIISPD